MYWTPRLSFLALVHPVFNASPLPRSLRLKHGHQPHPLDFKRPRLHRNRGGSAAGITWLICWRDDREVPGWWGWLQDMPALHK